MKQTLALVFLVAAWVVVLAGLKWEHVQLDLGFVAIPLAGLGVPLLLASLFLFGRRSEPSAPED